MKSTGIEARNNKATETKGREKNSILYFSTELNHFLDHRFFPVFHYIGNITKMQKYTVNVSAKMVLFYY